MTLTEAEAKIILGTLDDVTGGNSDSIFSWDGDNDINDPYTAAFVKLFLAAGKDIPENLK